MPLALAALCQVGFASLVLMPGPLGLLGRRPVARRHGVHHVRDALAAWLPLLLTALGAVFTDAFEM